MTGPVTGPALRGLRAAVVAGMAVSIGALAHTAAGGLLPGAMSLLGLFALVAFVSAAVLARPAPYAVVAGLVVGGQFVTHTVLTAMTGHPGAHPPTAEQTLITVPPSGVRAGLSVVDTAPQVMSGPATPHWLQHLLDDLTGANLAMSLAHIGAAALVAGWLLLGERALAALLLMVGSRIDLACSAVRTSWRTTAPETAPISPAGSLGAIALLDRRRRAAAHGPTARRGPPAGLSTRISTPTT